MGVTVSRSVKKFFAEIQKDVSDKLKSAAEEAGIAAILNSPVRTGAFATSWTISDASNKGRSRRSSTDPSKRITESEAYEIAAQLQEQDLASLPDNITKIYLNNRAPHANFAMAARIGGELETVKARFFAKLKEEFR